MTAFNSLLQTISTKFGEGEAADVLHEFKKRYSCELFDQDDLYGALKQLQRLGAIDDDGDTKILEMLAEKTSKKDQVLELINGYRESVPPCKNGFVGRGDDMNRIIKLVTSNRVPGINLFGESGVGKTTLAKEVCKQLKDFETLSIDLRDIKDVKAVYFLVLQEFHLPAWDYSKERMYEHLEDLTRKTFLILDNIEQLLSKEDTADQEMRAKFLEFLKSIISTEASKRGRLKIILTSRMEIIEPSLKAKLFGEYKVEPFSKEVSKAFISRRVKEDFDVSSMEQDEALTEISELCRDTPYLLQGAEQLIRENYCTPVQVLQKITTQIEKGVPKEFACISALYDAIPSDHLNQVAVKISLLCRSFSVTTAMKIAEIKSEYDARFDLEILVNHKIITAEDVEGKRKYDLHALFKEFVISYLCKEHPSYNEVYEKAEQQFTVHFSGKLTKLVENWDIDFVKMYKKLEKNRANFELAVEVAAKYETLDLLLHSEDLRKNVPVAIFLESFKTINERKNLYNKWAEIFKSKGKWLSSANMTCWESIQLADMEGTQLAYKTLKKAEMLLAMAMLTSTSDQLKASEGFYRYCSGKINYMSSANLIDESSTAKKEELLSQALHDLEESLDIHKEVYGNHTLTARTLNLMGNCYMELDQPENAETFYLEAMDMKVKLVGSNRHCDIPTYYYQLSQVHEALGNTEIRRKKSFGQRIIEFISRPFKSVQERQQYELAAVFSKKALDLQKDLGVYDSDDTATFQRNLANILIGLEQYDEALKFAEKSYEIRNARLGRHPETVRILYLIGIIHEWRKDHNAALQSYEKAFEMEKSLPEDNHSVVRRLLCDRLEEMCKKTKRKDKLKEYEPRIKEIRKICPLVVTLTPTEETASLDHKSEVEKCDHQSESRSLSVDHQNEDEDFDHQSKSPSLSVDHQNEDEDFEDQSGDETPEILIIICVKKGKSCNSTTKRAFPLLTTHVSSDRREPVNVSYSVFKKHGYNNRIMNLTVLSSGCNEEPIQEEELKGYTRIIRSKKGFSLEKSNEAYLSISGGFGQQISELKWNFEEHLISTTELEVDKDGSQCEMNEKLCFSFQSERRLIFEETLKMSEVFPPSTAYQPDGIGERVDDSASCNYVTIDSAQEAVGENACNVNSSTRNVPEERRDLCSTQDDRVVNVTQVTQYNVNIVAKDSAQVAVGENACVINSTRNVSEERRAPCLTQESKEEKEEEEQKDR